MQRKRDDSIQEIIQQENSIKINIAIQRHITILAQTHLKIPSQSHESYIKSSLSLDKKSTPY